MPTLLIDKELHHVGQTSCDGVLVCISIFISLQTSYPFAPSAVCFTLSQCYSVPWWQHVPFPPYFFLLLSDYFYTLHYLTTYPVTMLSCNRLILTFPIFSNDGHIESQLNLLHDMIDVLKSQE